MAAAGGLTSQMKIMHLVLPVTTEYVLENLVMGFFDILWLFYIHKYDGFNLKHCYFILRSHWILHGWHLPVAAIKRPVFETFRKTPASRTLLQSSYSEVETVRQKFLLGVGTVNPGLGFQHSLWKIKFSVWEEPWIWPCFLWGMLQRCPLPAYTGSSIVISQKEIT